MLREACAELYLAFRQSAGGNYYWILYAVSLLYLFCFEPEKRKTFVYPSIFAVVLLFNPVVFGLIWMRISYSHWRLFWMIPVTGTICTAGVSLVCRMSSEIRRIAAGAAVILLLAAAGRNVYQTDYCRFEKAHNLFRLPEEAVAAASILLEQEEQPRAVVTSGLFCYLRQYSADIQMLYGRDTQGYIHRIEDESMAVYRMLDEEHPDFGRIGDEMMRLDYSYLVLWDGGKYDTEKMNADGFEKLGETGIYTIWRLARN